MERADEILAFLTATQAGLFAKILYNVPRLFIALKNRNLSMLFAATDEALEKLPVVTGKSFSELQQDPYGVEIFGNHISTLPTNKQWPLFTSINNFAYGSSESDIKNLNVKAVRIIAGVPILIIGKLIVYPGQLENAALKRHLGVLKPLAETNMMWLLIEKGQLKGRDLISLCVSDPEINKLCGSKLNFDDLLIRDFRTTAPPGITARDHYVELSMGYQAWTTLYVNTNVPRPVKTKLRFSAISTGLNFTALLTPDGKVYYIGAFEYATAVVQTVPLQIEGLPPIIKIRAGQNNLAMLDDQNTIWVIGKSTQHWIIAKHHIQSGPGIVSRYERVLSMATIQYDGLNQTYRAIGPLTQMKVSALPVVDFAVDIFHNDKLIILVDNPKPAHFDEVDYLSKTIRSLTNGIVTALVYSSDDQIELANLSFSWTVDIWRKFLRIAPFGNRQVIKDIDVANRKPILTDTGEIWVHMELDRQGRLLTADSDAATEYLGKTELRRIIYPREPNLRFVDIISGADKNIWALAPDGRIFIFSNVPFSELLDAYGTTYTGEYEPNVLSLYTKVDKVISMDSYQTDGGLNKAFLTKHFPAVPY